MNRTVCLLLFMLLPAAAQAQQRADVMLRGGTWTFTGELGGAAFTDFQRVQATLAPNTDESMEFERRLSARTTGLVGVRAGYWISDGWAVRAGVAYAPSTFTVANDDAAERILMEHGSGDYESYASLGIWTADATALFRFPRGFGRVVPYGIVGGGAVRYVRGGDAEMPPEARATFQHRKRTRAAAVFGLGAAVALQRHDMMLSFELTNHLSRSPLSDSATNEPFEVGGMAMQFDTSGEARDRGAQALTSNLRLVLGLNLVVR